MGFELPRQSYPDRFAFPPRAGELDKYNLGKKHRLNGKLSRTRHTARAFAGATKAIGWPVNANFLLGSIPMMIVIENLLDPAAVQLGRSLLAQATWVDGKVTAGVQSGAVKHNRQLPEHSAEAKQLGELILRRLGENTLFLSAAIPDKIFPPLFNCYGVGEGFGLHIDNAIRPIKGTSQAVRTDLSATLFFSNPSEYDGGELQIETAYGAQAVKLNAGDLVLYPSSSLHRVTPVTRGARLASFFWLQSMVRDEGQRGLLFDLDQSIQSLSQQLGINHNEVLRLTGVYHNLLRRWASC